MKNNKFVLKNGKLQLTDTSSSSCGCCDPCNEITCPGGGVPPFYEKPLPIKGVQFSFSCTDTWEAEAELSYTVSYFATNYPARINFYADCVTMSVYSKRYIKLSGMSALNGTYGSFKSPYGISYSTCDEQTPDDIIAGFCEGNSHPCCTGEDTSCLSCCHTLYVPYKLITVTEIFQDKFSMIINGESFPDIINVNQVCSFNVFASASTRTGFTINESGEAVFTNYAYPNITYISDMPTPNRPNPICYTEKDLPVRLISNKYGIRYFLIGKTGNIPNNGALRMYVDYSACQGNENACFSKGGCNFLDYSCRSDDLMPITSFSSNSCEYYISLDSDGTSLSPIAPDNCKEVTERGFFRSRMTEFSAEGESIFL